MIEHHPLGPSRQDRIALCPGSYNLSKGLARDETEESRQGTMLHQCIAAKILFGSYTNMNIVLNDFEADAVEACWEWVKPKLSGSDKLLVEQRVDLSGVNFGTADLIATFDEGKRARLVDWKFYRSVPREDALYRQQANYAAAIFDMSKKVDVVEAYLYIPWGKYEYHVDFHREQFGKLRDLVAKNIADAADPNAPRRPDIACCQHCPAIGACPEAQAKMREFSDLVPSHPDFARLALKDQKAAVAGAVAALAPDAVLASIGPAKLAKLVADALLERARTLMLDDGLESPEWEVNSVSGRRYISDPYQVMKAVCHQDALMKKEYLACCSVALGKLESAYSERVSAKNGMSAKEAKEGLAALISEYVSVGAPSSRIERKRQKEESNA